MARLLTSKSFTPYGFEWAYEGGEPQQLAFVLFHHLGDKERAVSLSDKFMREIVANLDNDWTLTSEEVDAAIGKEGADGFCPNSAAFRRLGTPSEA